MSTSLQNLPFELWRSITERKGIQATFAPVFTRYIGVENQSKYDSVLRTILVKAQEDSTHTIYFDGQIPMDADFDFINSIKNELASMEVSQIASQDITLFEDAELNHQFLIALEYITNLAIRQENFLNNSVRNNFICKMLLYAYLHIFSLSYQDRDYLTNKCIYYGSISKHDIYFLLLLNRFGFDVIYINPLKDDENFALVDSDQISTVHKNTQILPIQSWAERAKNGQIIEENRSITLDIETQIEEQLFTNSGIYRPWQFRNGTTSPIFFNSTLIDVEQNWNAPAKVRNGFKTVEKTVYVPHFFFEIEGEYNPIDKYAHLVNICSSSDNTLVLTSNGDELITHEINDSDKYQLMFCQLSNGSFDIEEIMKLPFYRYAPYNDETEKFLLNKINETIADTRLFKQPLTVSKEEILNFALLILQLDKRVIRLIDSFDFTGFIPKIVFFLEGETQLSKNTCYVLAYLGKIGFDIIIFSPAGLSDLNSYINAEYFNTVRLDVINYEQSFQAIQRKLKKQNFFSKLFN
ncbi:hypothetical protein FKX92_02035 [Streptococcus sanguinis]|uniref:Putative component of 'biosynthetic module' domain-containing protein n=1 Tax=Streptococcus sanguinis TaxID=1305 RepID=A0A5A7ZTP4_STRSA|nr:YceG family protein [Streptococcus sanguinis]KAA0119344.1 hypothetical protein FKX92_02035 [Streptococcus sanguinis]